MVRLRWDPRAKTEFDEACKEANGSALSGEVAATMRQLRPRQFRGIKRAAHPRIEVVPVWTEEPWSILYASVNGHRTLLHFVHLLPATLPDEAFLLAENRLDHPMITR